MNRKHRMSNRDMAITFQNAMSEVIMKDSMLVKEIINHALKYIHETKDRGKFLDDCQKSTDKRFKKVKNE